MREELLAEWKPSEIQEITKKDSSLDGNWIDILLKDKGFEVIEWNPKNSIVEYRAAFATGNGDRVTFKALDSDEVRHGFIYTRFVYGQDAKNIAFVEVTP